MKELLQLAWDALLFRDEAYAQHVARADVLKRGLTLLVLVALLAGIVSFLVGLVGDLRPMDPLAQQREVEQGFREFFKTVGPYLDLPSGFEKQMLAYARPAMEIGFRIAALPTPLPKALGGVFENLGALLSLPFNRMAGWMGYSIWVLLAAKLLGGRATAAQMLGATALYAVPHVLDILGPVPCLGGLLGLVATVWGIAIYVKALAVANGFTIGRAIAATVVPAIFFAVLSLLGLLMILIPALTTSR
jgi:hypothetical protein